MRYLVVLVIACSGCRGTMEENFGDWNACISAGQFVGDKIKSVEDGRTGKVVKVYGSSYRCSDARRPKLAEVRYE